MQLKCLSCVAKAKMDDKPQALEDAQTDAITLVPVWKTHVHESGQQIVMCVMEPVCYPHMVVMNPLLL